MKDSWKKIPKYLGIIVSIIVGFFFLKIIARVIFLWFIYGPISEAVTSTFGVSNLVTKIASLIASVLLAMAIPWLIAVAIFGKKKKEVFITLLVVFVFLTGFLFFESQRSFFNSATGQPAKYYCISNGDVKFSVNAGTDQESGAEFVLINKDFVKKYKIWKKYNNGEKVNHFDSFTGEANFKYIKRENGQIEIYPNLIRFDPVGGQELKILTREIAEEYVKRKKISTSSKARTRPIPTLSLRDAEWSIKKITANWTFVANVYNGDTVSYKSPKAFKTKYEPGGEYYQNPSVKGKTWSYDIDGCPESGTKMYMRSLDDTEFEVRYRITSNKPPIQTRSNPPPKNIEWTSLKVSQASTEVCRVYNGDRFYYKNAPYGFWIKDSEGDEYFHNPTKTDEVRYFNFYDFNSSNVDIFIRSNQIFEMNFKIVRK